MAIKKFYIGSFGPFEYDDTELIDDIDGDFAGETRKAMATTGDLITGDVITEEQIVQADLIFQGAGKGLSFGSLYLHEGAQNIDISTPGQGVYAKITGLTTGLLNNVTINSDAFRVANPGIYKVDWQISGDSQGNNKDYEVDIFLNSVEQADGSARREFATVASLGSISGTGLIDVTSASHDIDLRIKETGAGAGTDFDIFNLNFNILQVGGT